MPAPRIAAGQFPLGGEFRRNLGHARRQAARAAALGTEAVHLPVAALSGWAGVTLAEWEGCDWAAGCGPTAAACGSTAPSATARSGLCASWSCCGRGAGKWKGKYGASASA